MTEFKQKILILIAAFTVAGLAYLMGKPIEACLFIFAGMVLLGIKFVLV